MPEQIKQLRGENGGATTGYSVFKVLKKMARYCWFYYSTNVLNNKGVTANGQTTQFVYNGDGNMVKKINPDGSKTITIGSVYEVNKDAGGTVTGTTTYYPAAGAMRVNGTLYYVLGDQLGSASVVLDASGTTVGETRYTPFGETRVTSGSMHTDKLYTGQREMSGLGIYYYNARFYDPGLGRFISPDSIVPSEANPQAWNRYSYVLNNPINSTDPTGHRNCEEDGYNCDKSVLSSIVVYPSPTRIQTTPSTITPRPSVTPTFDSPMKTVVAALTTTPTPGGPTPGYRLVPGPTLTPENQIIDATPEAPNTVPANTVIGFSYSGNTPNGVTSESWEIVFGQGIYHSTVIQGSGWGESATANIYFGQVYGIQQPSDYEGLGQAFSATASLLVGFTAAVFGGPSENSPGGWYVGFAPGAGLSFSGTINNTELVTPFK